jgi:hypothetical protein
MITHELDHEQVNEISAELIQDLTKGEAKSYVWQSKQSGYIGAWCSGINMHEFNEWLKYKRHDYGLILEHEETERRAELIKVLVKPK